MVVPMHKISRIFALLTASGVVCFSLPSAVSAVAIPTASDLESLGSASGDRPESSSLTAEVNAVEMDAQENILSVTWSVENNGTSDVVLSWLHEGSYTYEGSYFSGVTANSEEIGQRLHPLMDGSGACVCSGNHATDFNNVVYPNNKLTYWSIYPAPEGTDSITIEIPGFDPIEDIPIS